MKIHNIFYSKSVLLETVGFDNWHEYIITVFGLKDKTLLPAIAILLSTMITFLSTMIDAYIFTPAAGIWVLLILTIADIFFGCAASKVVKGQSIDPWRMSKAGARCATQIFFTFGLFQTSLVWPVIQKWMVDGFLLLFVLATFWSGFKNAHLLKLVSDEVYVLVEGFLSIDKLFKRFMGSKDNSSAPQAQATIIQEETQPTQN